MKHLLKKGISPLIATVLIIGFTVALAAVILTWGTSFTKQIAKGTEDTTEIQLACAQDVQFDVKSACYDDVNNGIKFIVENNGNRDIVNFSVRLKITDTNVVSGNVGSAQVSRFGLKPFTAFASADPEDPNFQGLSGQEGSVTEVTLLPVIKIAGKEVTCAQSIDSYSPAIEGEVLDLC